MKHGSDWTQKDRKTKTEVGRMREEYGKKKHTTEELG